MNRYFAGYEQLFLMNLSNGDNKDITQTSFPVTVPIKDNMVYLNDLLNSEVRGTGFDGYIGAKDNGLLQYCEPINEIKHLPKVLVIQLKRFYFDFGTQTAKKINTNVSFPSDLFFGNSDSQDYQTVNCLQQSILKGQPIKYKLRGFVSHIGNSAQVGHYVAYVKDMTTENWLHYNDEAVSRYDQARYSWTPYLLFYELEQTENLQELQIPENQQELILNAQEDEVLPRSVQPIYSHERNIELLEQKESLEKEIKSYRKMLKIAEKDNNEDYLNACTEELNILLVQLLEVNRQMVVNYHTQN